MGELSKILQLRDVGWIEFGSHAAFRDPGNDRKRMPGDRTHHVDTEALWQRVADAAAAEARYQPPPQRVRAVKSAFTMTGRSAKRRETAGLLQLSYDSFLQPALVVVRSGAMSIRQI